MALFFKQKTAYEITTRLVGSEMCIRDRNKEPYISGLEKQDSISVDMHYTCAYMGKNEALQVCTSIALAGYRQWGPEFLDHVERLLEGMRDQ